MSAYPMIQAPTFGDLRDRLVKDYECAFKKDIQKIDDSEEEIEITYFERVLDGEIFSRVVDFKSDDERVSSWVLRGILKKLKVPLADFGLTLG